jgi:hypothetical protein
MEVGANGVIDVHLSATEVSSGKQVTEFRQPLELSLTYAGSSPEDLDKLAIVHVVDGDVVEAVASVVHADQQAVCGEIWHFSRYAIAAE